MKRYIATFATFLVVMLPIALAAAAGVSPTKSTKDTGKVTGHMPGLAYIKGREGKIVSVQTPTGSVHLFVQQMGTTALRIGEVVVFSGPTTTLANLIVVDTTDGYLYRESGKTMQEEMAEKTAQAMAQAQKQLADLATKGIPNAVPISMIETKDQKEEKRQKDIDEKQSQTLNLLMSLLGILVALLAFERVPRLVVMVVSAVKRIFGRGPAKEQSTPPDAA